MYQLCHAQDQVQWCAWFKPGSMRHICFVRVTQTHACRSKRLLCTYTADEHKEQQKFSLELANGQPEHMDIDMSRLENYDHQKASTHKFQLCQLLSVIENLNA